MADVGTLPESGRWLQPRLGWAGTAGVRKDVAGIGESRLKIQAPDRTPGWECASGTPAERAVQGPPDPVAQEGGKSGVASLS